MKVWISALVLEMSLPKLREFAAQDSASIAANGYSGDRPKIRPMFSIPNYTDRRIHSSI